MPKHPKPWFRKGRGWYIQRNGKQIFLGTKKPAALEEYHQVMGEEPIAVAGGTVAAFADAFLDWVQKHRSEATYEWYRSRIQSFLDRNPALPARKLAHFHVQQWIDSFPVSNGTRRNYARSMIRCFNWCDKQGLVQPSPLKGFEMPEAGVRETVITPQEYAAIMAVIKREPFRDLLTFAWESGARAQECLAAEARHYDPEGHRLVFPVKEAKGKKKPRIIHLSEKAEEIISRLAKRYPQDRLFRNLDGDPWTTDAVNCAFTALQIRMGRRAMKAKGLTNKKGKLISPTLNKQIAAVRPKLALNFRDGTAKTDEQLIEEAMRKVANRLAVTLAPKYCLTVFRHSYCHRLLKAGVDALTVANLMGHSGISMVAKVYSHLNQAQDYLRDALRKAAG